ncbi:hypothetical protein A0H81_00195 [Grifola frondosa]|uniref:Uncharacterized protein n=1 Tax=Grifola frondosa TaxID=5627 RepID=A0A1C7MR49_GRIFR|nr:hypothetical protein A0H81_00195 [Grifola frondosa]
MRNFDMGSDIAGDASRGGFVCVGAFDDMMDGVTMHQIDQLTLFDQIILPESLGSARCQQQHCNAQDLVGRNLYSPVIP